MQGEIAHFIQFVPIGKSEYKYISAKYSVMAKKGVC